MQHMSNFFYAAHDFCMHHISNFFIQRMSNYFMQHTSSFYAAYKQVRMQCMSNFLCAAYEQVYDVVYEQVFPQCSDLEGCQYFSSF